MPESVTPEQIFSILSDKDSVGLLKEAYVRKLNSSKYVGKLSKKQIYTKLKRLATAGLIEKRENSYYRATTLGSLIYNGHVKTIEDAIANYWQLKAIDMLKSREDFPAAHKESVINDIVSGSNLKNLMNSTHLSGFSIVKDWNRLVVEVIRMLEDANKEIYFASRYHDPHVSKKMFEKVEKGVMLHFIDGNTRQISVESRLNAILRTPPDEKTYRMVSRIIRSHCFDLKYLEPTTVVNGEKSTIIPTFNSFLVIDGNQVLYENVNYANPEEFTVAFAAYDDPYLAEQFINYFTLLSKQSVPSKLLQDARVRA